MSPTIDMPFGDPLPPGSVWLVGAGPGDPGHLTLFALGALRQADAVVHDALIDARVLALAGPGAELVPVGKRGGRPSADQDGINDLLVRFARAGRRVVRLKGGDPMVFARGGEEAWALAAAGVPFRVVPGVTAGLAGLAAAGIPPTHRGVNQAVLLLTGHDPDGPDAVDWTAAARLGQPLVLYMGWARWPRIAAALRAGGLSPDTPAAAIAAATLPDQRVVVATLGTLAGAAAELVAPVLVVVGDIVRLRERLGTVGAPRWPHAG